MRPAAFYRVELSRGDLSDATFAAWLAQGSANAAATRRMRPGTPVRFVHDGRVVDGTFVAVCRHPYGHLTGLCHVRVGRRRVLACRAGLIAQGAGGAR